jgi:hypothetical protein
MILWTWRRALPLRPGEKYHRRPACVPDLRLEICEQRCGQGLVSGSKSSPLVGTGDTGGTPMTLWTWRRACRSGQAKSIIGVPPVFRICGWEICEWHCGQGPACCSKLSPLVGTGDTGGDAYDTLGLATCVMLTLNSSPALCYCDAQRSETSAIP